MKALLPLAEARESADSPVFRIYWTRRQELYNGVKRSTNRDQGRQDLLKASVFFYPLLFEEEDVSSLLEISSDFSNLRQ